MRAPVAKQTRALAPAASLDLGANACGHHNAIFLIHHLTISLVACPVVNEAP
jgi:hypothetical protein